MSLNLSLPARIRNLLSQVRQICRRKPVPIKTEPTALLPPPPPASVPKLAQRQVPTGRTAIRTSKTELQESSAALYLALGPAEQAVVRDYFAAAHEVNKLLLSIRLYGKIFSCEALLGRFEKLELHYHGLGLLPVLPSAVDSESAADINRLIERGLIQARLSLNIGSNGCGKATYQSITGDGAGQAPKSAAPATTRGICTYSAGIRRHVHNLDRRFRLKERETGHGHAKH